MKEEGGEEEKEGNGEDEKEKETVGTNEETKQTNTNNNIDLANTNNTNSTNDPFLYVINLVHTRKDRSKKRGATIRSLAIFCKHKLFEMWGPLLSHVLTEYFKSESRDTLIDFYQTINALDFSDVFGRFLKCYPFMQYCGGEGGGRGGGRGGGGEGGGVGGGENWNRGEVRWKVGILFCERVGFDF